MDKVLASPEVEVKSPTSKVMPTLEEITPSSKALDDVFLMQAAGIESYINGSDIGENFDKYRESFNPRAEAEMLSKTKATIDATAVVQSIEDNPYAGGYSVETNLQAASIAKTQALVDGNNPDRQFVESVTEGAQGFANLERNASEMELQRLLMETQENVTGLQKVGGFIGAFVPFADTVAQTALTGEFFGREEALQSAIVTYKNKPIEERIRLFPSLKENLFFHLGAWQGAETLAKFIEPGGEYNVNDFNSWWSALDVADIVPIVAGAGKFLQSRTMVKTLQATGDTKTAVKANVAAVIDEDVAETLGTTSESAVSTALPFKMDEVDIQSADSLSTESIEEFKAMSAGVTEDIISERTFVREGLIDAPDRLVAEEQVRATLQNAKHENITWDSSNEDYTVFSYQAKDVNGNMFHETFKMELNLDVAGDWEESALRAGLPSIASPTVWLKGSARRTVDQAQRLDFATATVKKQLAEVMEEAIKPLGSPLKPGSQKRREAVSRALIAGDEYIDDATGVRGKIFSPDELHDIYKLDSKQSEAYYRMNNAFDNLWQIANHEKRKEMTLLKYKGVELVNGERTYGKIQDTAGSALESLRKGEVRYIYDDVSGKVVKNGGREGWMDTHYDDGKVLIRLDAPYQTTDEAVGQVKFMLVNRDSVGDLPEQILQKNVGYVTRFNEEASYFVKENIASKIDGQDSSYPKTLRFFNNKADADEHVKRLEAEATTQGQKITTGSKNRYSALEDREAESFSSLIGDFSHGSGGLYTGVRSQDELLFGLDGHKSQRIDPFQALAKNIEAVSRVTTLNEWRLGLEQKWLNSVNAHLKRIGAQGTADSFGNVPETMANTEAGAFFLQMERQIREWQGFPSAAENTWKGATQRTMNWAASKGYNESIVRGIGSMKSLDPIAKAKSAAFHSLLGWYNPAHLWIQAQGTSVSLAIAGKKFPQVMRNSSAFTALGEAANPTAWRIKAAAKIAAVDPVEFEAMHKLWVKSGLGATVTQTADHSAALKGFGVVNQAIKKASDQGLFFYRNGELVNRRTAFTTAIERYKDSKGVSSVQGIGDEALKEILADTNNLLLNMSKANKANFQKGIMSLPTQFLQVTTKTMETAIGANGNFTKGERGRMLLGQLALYGTAGVPLVGLPTMYAMEVIGVTQEDINNNPVAFKSIQDGFWGAVSMWVLGEDMEVATRGSLVRGIGDLSERIFSSDSTMVEALLGAFGTTGVRAWEGWAEQMKDMTLSAHNNTALEIAEIPMLGTLSAISSWRNIEKAVIMRNLHKIEDKHGTATVDKRFNLGAEVGAILGFRLAAETEPWTLKDRTAALASANKKIATEVIRLQNTYALKAETVGVDAEDRKILRENLAFLMQTTNDPSSLQDINDMVLSNFTQDSKQVQARTRYINKNSGSLTEGLWTLKDAALGTSIIILDDIEEE